MIIITHNWSCIIDNALCMYRENDDDGPLCICCLFDQDSNCCKECKFQGKIQLLHNDCFQIATAHIDYI